MIVDPLRDIEAIAGIEARRDAPIAPHTTFRIGGPADLLVQPRRTDALEELLKLVRRHGLELLVIGAGSDLLIADAGFRGVVVKIPAGLEPIRVDGNRLTADAGRPLPELMRRARRAGLAGLEFTGGIPGSLGGSLAVNAGAWGADMAGIADSMVGIDDRGEKVEIRAGEVRWSYRSAEFPRPMVITEATLRLEAGDPAAIRELEESWHDARRRSQPLGERSAGCVFRNTHCGEAGRLIDEAGLKGERIGGALVSPIHANFIVNAGGATATQVAQLIDRVRRRVFEVHGVHLELEIRLVGVSLETTPPAGGAGNGRQGR